MMIQARKIKNVRAREVLDSRGFPTVEVEIEVEDTKHQGEVVCGRAMVPSGASTGDGEALELRDQDPKRFLGKGVLRAVQNVREKIAPAILNQEFSALSVLDHLLCQLDGTPMKSKLGANAILGVSMAFCRAHSLAHRITVDQYLASLNKSAGTTLPVPLMNILNGGKHADNGLAIQEFMIVPAGFSSFSEALRAGSEIFHRLKKILHQEGLSTGVGDEGGFAPVFSGEATHEQALTSIQQAVSEAGYQPGGNVFLALDCAASEFSNREGYYQFEGKSRTSEEMISIYDEWTRRFPIISIEDGLGEHDWKGWKALTQALRGKCQLIGDDIFVTNPTLLKKGIDENIGSAILIKLNQIGTVTETLETMKLASKSGYNSIASHRSGETEDSFIADLAVGTDCGQIKTGSACRSDRIAKYNQLLRLEERLGSQGKFAGLTPFSKITPFGKN